LPFSVVSNDSSTLAVIRGATAEFWAGSVELESRIAELKKTPAIAWNERDDLVRIKANPDLSRE
jgi:hypothetical protein